MSPMKERRPKRKSFMKYLINLLTRTRPVRRSSLTEKEKVSQMLCFSRHVYGNIPLIPAPLNFSESAVSKETVPPLKTSKKYNKTYEDARLWVTNYYIPDEILTFLQVKTLMPDAIGIQKELLAPLLTPNQVVWPTVEGNLFEMVNQLKTYLADYTEEEKQIFAERLRRHLIPALEEAVESM